MVALNSAEVELYASLGRACQTLGIMNLALDFGVKFQAIVHTDASAALAISHRRGLGKLRHINVHWLWVQESIKNGDVEARKVNGKDNPADLMTEHLPSNDITKRLGDMNFEIATGRADKSLKLSNVAIDEPEQDYVNETRAQLLTRKWQEVLRQHPPRKEDSLRALLEFAMSMPKLPAHPVPSGPGNLSAKARDKQITETADHWINDNQCVIRRHQKPRRTLCDPFQCKGAPKFGSLTST